MQFDIFMSPVDVEFYKNLGDEFATAEEKLFFEKMHYKMEKEPAWANDLIMAEYDNEDGIYLVRCYDHEFIIGHQVGEVIDEEEYAMSFAEAMNLNLKTCGFLERDITLLEWLRERNFKGVQYDHNYDLM